MMAMIDGKRHASFKAAVRFAKERLCLATK